MKDYAKYSFWLETAADSLAPRPTLSASTTVDVAILGGGYSGLWTAYYLLRANPGLRVAILEREIVGFGASGRNGGWCSSRFPVTPAVLEERYGAEAARQLILAMFASVDEVGRVCTEEGISADYRKGGILSLARGVHQLPMIRASYAAYERLGLGDRFKLLRVEECCERVRVANVHGGLYTHEGASLHPGRLVRGWQLSWSGGEARFTRIQMSRRCAAAVMRVSSLPLVSCVPSAPSFLQVKPI